MDTHGRATTGITSFKLFMAYPGVFMVDDATIFKALLRRARTAGSICMHAENGGVIDTLVKEALRKGETAPKYHALTRPDARRGRGHRPRDRARRDGGRARSTSSTSPARTRSRR